jgi:CopG family transcriptional regulator, nickel-responsive regulator
MAELERIGISLDAELLSMFDQLISEQGYPSRSEAVRDLVRQQLSERRIGDPDAQAVAAVFLVYDHHSTKLTKSLIDLQHTHTSGTSLHVISSLHVHLNEHDCLEVIVLRGRVGAINKMADELLSKKGVKLGRMNVVATAEGVP